MAAATSQPGGGGLLLPVAGTLAALALGWWALRRLPAAAAQVLEPLRPGESPAERQARTQRETAEKARATSPELEQQIAARIQQIGYRAAMLEQLGDDPQYGATAREAQWARIGPEGRAAILKDPKSSAVLRALLRAYERGERLVRTAEPRPGSSASDRTAIGDALSDAQRGSGEPQVRGRFDASGQWVPG